jgi:hypothetical protein
MPLEEFAQQIARAAVVIDNEDMGVGLHAADPERVSTQYAAS